MDRKIGDRNWWLMVLFFFTLWLVFRLFTHTPISHAQATPLNNPSSLLIVAAEGYRSVIETNDQLYLITFDIFYATAADRPSENASATMILNLNDGATVHALAVPTSFVHRGYVRGVTGMYFAAGDADIPTWASATLVAEITGNPALSWVSGQPLSNQQNPDDNTAADFETQQAAIVTHLRGQLPLLENNWFAATADITDLIAGQPAVLTHRGRISTAIVPGSAQPYPQPVLILRG